MIVEERFTLPPNLYKDIPLSLDHSFGFNGFGELTYYRTYSRYDLEKKKQETWLDTCVRVTEGVMSIRKDWYKKMGLKWEKKEWEGLATQMLSYMYQMKFLPPGRGLWAMGSQHVYEVGSMALNNCANTSLNADTLADDLAWAMDALMCGCGVGFRLPSPHIKIVLPTLQDSYGIKVGWIIPDSREGWTHSVRLLVNALLDGRSIFFDYREIRGFGQLIKRFGGTSSGAGPLIILHRRISAYFNNYRRHLISQTRLLADLANAVGYCVVSGNVRRGAEILLGHLNDKDFLDLKVPRKRNENLDKRLKEAFEVSKGDQKNSYANTIKILYESDLVDRDFLDDRASICGLSNNSVLLEDHVEFLGINKILDGIRANGDPGGLNLLNMKKYGRFGDTSLRDETANSCNPCGEIPLGDKELCNLVEIFPTLCSDRKELYNATRLATIYSQSVSLLATHSPETNKVIAKNRRIGVSLTGVADWLDKIGAVRLTRVLRDLYPIVKRTSEEFAELAGVPSPIRHTTIKPSGTVSQLAGVSSGMHFPTFPLAIRRIRIANDTPLNSLLKKALIPYEIDIQDSGANVFEFPINQGSTRPATKVSAWEQFAFLSMLQREWSDNMVSCTIYFNKEAEGEQIEQMLGQFLPLIKSFSMLPHSDLGTHPQMPYQGITEEEYKKRIRSLRLPDYSLYKGVGREADMPESILYCDNDSCEI